MLQDDRAGRKCRQPSSELCSELPDRTGEEQERVPGRGLSRAAGSAGFAGGVRAGPTLGALPVHTGAEGLVVISNKACGRGLMIQMPASPSP